MEILGPPLKFTSHTMSTQPPRSKLRVNCFGVSLDGYGAGPQQDLSNPLGVGGMALHEWFFPTRTFQGMHGGGKGGTTGIDEDFAARGMAGLGAWILCRNMFGPIRGEWDEEWSGWWGPEPPYHAPVFVLTHHAHAPIEMEGGTTFHFVTDGFDAAYAQARETAGADGIDIAGGASTVRQALLAGVIDELWLDIAPVLLGSGEGIFNGVAEFDFEPAEVLHSPLATHICYRRAA